MGDIEEKWAIFWCGLLEPIIFSDIEPEGVQAYLKTVAEREVRFPNGRIGRPSLSTLRRKLGRFRQGGFEALKRRPRSDRGASRNADRRVIDKAIELKKEQPYRSDRVINRFLRELYGAPVPRSTLYRHLKMAGATRLKLGACKEPVRKRWSRDKTHDLWVGDFEEGPYVLDAGEPRLTHLSAFIDCHSRFVVEARYHFRQNLDTLCDGLVRALAVHGAPGAVYLDNAKVYHSNGLRSALYGINARLIHRPAGDPAPGGLIERFFGTVQGQFEREARAGDMLSLSELNRFFAAWLSEAYHGQVHSETGQTPAERYEKGLSAIRPVNMADVMEAFMRKVRRKVNPTFSDIQLDNRLYAVDPRLRGDAVEVRFDPFSDPERVAIHSLQGRYLGEGVLHRRENGQPAGGPGRDGKPVHDYLGLLRRDHEKRIDAESQRIDYARAMAPKAGSFADFADRLARLRGQAGISAFSADELERLKKLHARHPDIDRRLLKKAFENIHHGSVAAIVSELKRLKKEQA